VLSAAAEAFCATAEHREGAGGRLVDALRLCAARSSSSSSSSSSGCPFATHEHFATHKHCQHGHACSFNHGDARKLVRDGRRGQGTRGLLVLAKQSSRLPCVYSVNMDQLEAGQRDAF